MYPMDTIHVPNVCSCSLLPLFVCLYLLPHCLSLSVTEKYICSYGWTYWEMSKDNIRLLITEIIIVSFFVVECFPCFPQTVNFSASAQQSNQWKKWFSFLKVESTVDTFWTNWTILDIGFKFPFIFLKTLPKFLIHGVI